VAGDGGRANNTMDSSRRHIAIIGMAGRFPGAATVDALWRNLRDGVESIRSFDERDREPGWLQHPPYPNAPLVLAGGLLDGIEYFDADFFGITAREARMLDPQHRLLLECAWETFEDAGYRPDRPPGDVGVFAGCGVNTYLLNLLSQPELLDGIDPRQVVLANEKDYLATRISYRLGLKGPSVTVQTACSTSLVAVHLAAQSILNGECDSALAGGVALRIPQRGGYYYVAEGIDARDGHCRAFDQRADGTVAGSGCGLVLLRRYEDAVRSRDRIRAVIRGSAVNNDGGSKVGYTAPLAAGQTAVITEALAIADLEPRDIGYVEAHGTGTLLGDAVEVAALAAAFGDPSPAATVCLGSLKTNIGHLDAAAGVAGLIKTVLALEHGEIPPTLHFSAPNPHLRLETTPFRVNNRLEHWSNETGPRRAGVSSFGIGGTNAHVVLEEAAAVSTRSSSDTWHVLPVSARDRDALREACARLAAWLIADDAPSLDAVALTLQTGRSEFANRRVVVCQSAVEAARLLT